MRGKRDKEDEGGGEIQRMRRKRDKDDEGKRKKR